MTMEHVMDLSGPRAKLSRALELQGELARYIESTLEPVENRPSLALRFEAGTNEYVLYVDRVPDLQPFLTRVALLLGDAVHNMRSALDHLVYQLALLHTGGVVSRRKLTQFPIVDNPEKFKLTAKNYLGEVEPVHRKIIERFQPYYPMEENISVGLYFHPLAMLRDLSNADKHRLLTPVLVPSTGLSLDSMSTLAIYIFGLISQIFTDNEPKAEAMIPGLEIVRFQMGGQNTTIDSMPVGHALPSIALEDGRSVVPVLDKLARAVDRVLSAFTS